MLSLVVLVTAIGLLAWLVEDQKRQSRARLVKPRTLGPSWAPNGISTIQLSLEDRIGLENWLSILEPEVWVFVNGVRFRLGSMEHRAVTWMAQMNFQHKINNDPISVEYVIGDVGLFESQKVALKHLLFAQRYGFKPETLKPYMRGE